MGLTLSVLVYLARHRDFKGLSLVLVALKFWGWRVELPWADPVSALVIQAVVVVGQTGITDDPCGVGALDEAAEPEGTKLSISFIWSDRPVSCLKLSLQCRHATWCTVATGSEKSAAGNSQSIN